MATDGQSMIYTQSTITSVCRLCQRDQILRGSHIVPEFLYSDLYNDKYQMMGINGLGRRGWAVVQKGLREHLLCEMCEQHFNDRFEKPFLEQWVMAAPLPNPWNFSDVHWCSFDYISFKLFHLSVLFRAGVSSLPTFSTISLGPHEEKLRKLLRSVIPGENWEYPIIGNAIVHHKTKRIMPMVTQPTRSSFNGHCCYGMAYGGVQWWISVSSHRNAEFELVGLQPDGRMPFLAVPWNEVPTIQSAAAALREARPYQATLESTES